MSFYLESGKKSDCYNCTACATVCPKQCITMEKDEKDGYIYPKIDKTKCIECGRCKQVCINLKSQELQNKIQKALVLYNRDSKTRSTSASGGISHILMEYIIENDGVVYGASYDKNLKVVHTRATTIEECEKYKTSKYVRSDIQNIYKQVIQDLEKGKKVLFTGTPCQIAGLKSVVSEKLQAELILCEIMCDCVASPILFEKFKKQIEKKYQSKIKTINFRSKECGAHNKTMKIEFINGEEILLKQKEQNLYSEYMQIFGCGMSAPECCTKCELEHINERTADFTIGDYWGKKEILKDDNQGISLLLINSKKAEKIFETYIKDKVNYQQVEILQALDSNHQQHKGVILNKREFMEDLPRLSFEELAQKYVRKYRWRTNLGKMIPKSMKEKLKKIIKG